jgi:hypothetical protein
MSHASKVLAERKDLNDRESSQLFTFEEAIEKRRQDLREYRADLEKAQLSLTLGLRAATSKWAAERLQLESRIDNEADQLEILEKHLRIVKELGKIHEVDNKTADVQRRIRSLKHNSEIGRAKARIEALKQDIKTENRNYRDGIRALSRDMPSSTVCTDDFLVESKRGIADAVAGLRNEIARTEEERKEVRSRLSARAQEVEQSRKSIREMRGATSEFVTWKERRQMFRENAVQELKKLRSLRIENGKVRRVLRVERCKCVRCADQIDALVAEVNNLRRLKHKEHRRTQKIDRALIRLPDLIDGPSVQPQHRGARLTTLDSALTNMAGRVQSLRDKLGLHRARNSEHRRRLPSIPSGTFHAFAKQITDLMARIQLEKARWTPDLHISSIELLVKSWADQLREVDPRV